MLLNQSCACMHVRSIINRIIVTAVNYRPCYSKSLMFLTLWLQASWCRRWSLEYSLLSLHRTTEYSKQHTNESYLRHLLCIKSDENLLFLEFHIKCFPVDHLHIHCQVQSAVILCIEYTQRNSMSQLWIRLSLYYV